MSIKQTIRNVMAGFVLLFGLSFFLTQTPVLAASCTPTAKTQCCGGVQTSIISCKQDNTGNDYTNTGLWGILLIAVNILTAGVGVVALAGIVYGAILYTSAGGNQEQVKKAITIFTNVVIGVIAFAGMWALLNFLIPGGVFKQ